MMAPDFSGLAIFALIGLFATLLFIIGFIIAAVTYFLGYWHFGVTI